MSDKFYHYRYECTNCGHIHFRDERDTSMNAELRCKKCDSLAFGLVREDHVLKEPKKIQPNAKRKMKISLDILS